MIFLPVRLYERAMMMIKLTSRKLTAIFFALALLVPALPAFANPDGLDLPSVFDGSAFDEAAHEGESIVDGRFDDSILEENHDAPINAIPDDEILDHYDNAEDDADDMMGALGEDAPTPPMGRAIYEHQ